MSDVYQFVGYSRRDLIGGRGLIMLTLRLQMLYTMSINLSEIFRFSLHLKHFSPDECLA